MRIGFCVFVLALPNLGCTTLSLQHHTVRQTESLGDLRYQQVLDNLAALAENPAVLPAYASIIAGSASLSDTGTATAATAFDREQVRKAITRAYFQTQTIDLMAQRRVSENWTLDPVTGPERLVAIRAACRWALWGPQALPPEDHRILSAFDESLPLNTEAEYLAAAGYYFAVATDLDKIPSGWLHVGGLKDVPRHAVFTAHSGHTWVWVCADGMEALSAFTLVVHILSRTAADSVFHPAPAVRTLVKQGRIVKSGERLDANGVPATPDAPTVKATVYVDRFGNLVAGPDAYFAGFPYKKRFDDIGTSAFIRSTVAAAAAANKSP
jgi:hypothetical protein